MFLANRAVWVSSSSSTAEGTVTRCLARQEIEGGNEIIISTARSGLPQARRRKESTKDNSPVCKVEDRNSSMYEKGKDDQDECFRVALTPNAIRCMVHGAVATTSVYNGDAITDEEGEGIVLSNKPTVGGPFVIRLYDLKRRQIQSNDNVGSSENNENHGHMCPIMFAASISDGTKSCLGTILETKKGQLENLSECIVSVSGFVMGMTSSLLNDGTNYSAATARYDSWSDNYGEENKQNNSSEASITSEREAQYSHYIFITRYEILYEKRAGLKDNNYTDITSDKWQISIENDEKLFIAKELLSQKCAYEKRGRIASLIASTKLKMEDFISDNQGAIAGQQSHYHHRDTTIARADKIVEDGLEVSNFIEQHSAIMALKRKKENASLLSSSSFSLMLGSLKYFQNYISAIKEFDQTQREEQFTSMLDKIEEYCVHHSREEILGSKSTYCEEQSWMQNTETLEYALQCKDEVLSSELLLRWHALLLDDGLEQEAGCFRSEKVSKRVGELCDNLERHWLPKIKDEPTNPVQIASFAAAAMLGFLDIVPFEVGNQRLARIVLNWTLRRAGLPFCITLYSNQEEKLSYLHAIQLTKQNLYLVPQGYVDESETTMILRSTGGLVPLVGHLLDRLARATADLCMLVEKKTFIASEETDARLLRLAREKAAEGSCIICFESKPNIATLCCGKPIHFNCLAEWLKSNSSCPQCRSNMPSFSVDKRSCERIDDRRVEYGRERISIRDFSTEEYADEFLFNSSSSSSSEESPTSSSSSSSENSAFLYSGLDYGVNDIQSVTSIDDDESTRSISSLLPTRSDTPTPFQRQPRSHYVTSDEEEQHDSYRNNDDASSTTTYRSDTDDDIDRYSFHTNDSQRSLTNFESNFELARNDDIDIVSETQSTDYYDRNDRYELLNRDNSDDSENSSYRENGNSSREISIRTSSMSLDFAPFRVSFLDPELLESVQNVQNGGRHNFENSRRNDGENVVEIPEFLYLRNTDDVHPPNSVTNSCEFPLRRITSRRSRWS